MSGHSKWSTIKRKKGAIDAKKAANFTKLAREIEVAAREKGADLSMNFRLRLAIDRARSANMPKNKIEKAIERGAGLGGTDNIEELIYEGYAPGGIALLIKALTDNRNRTAKDIKHILSKNGGSLANPGAVSFMFNKKAVFEVIITNLVDQEDLQLSLIDYEVEEFLNDGDNLIIIVPVEQASAVESFLNKQNLKIISFSLDMIATSTIDVLETNIESLNKIITDLELLDDVETVYTNGNYVS